MNLAIVSDEISRDFQSAVEIGTGWGITAYEIRRLGSGRVPRVSEDDVKLVDHIRKEQGVSITSLSSGLLKLADDHPEVEQRLTEDLPRACELAQQWGSDMIVEFTFLKPEAAHQGPAPDKVVDLLRRAADITQQNGCRLALENEHVCWADTGKATAELIDRIDHDNVSVNWDPTNASHFDETPFPDGYNAVKDTVSHVHVKDFDAQDDRITVVPGEGGTDWPGQFRALIDDGYTGLIVVETHMRPRIEKSRQCVAAVKDMLVALCGQA